MELTQIQNTLVIENTVIAGYSNVYILQKIETSTDSSSNLGYFISTSGGSFALTIDGYYKVYRFSITTTENAGYYIDGQTVYAPGGDELYDNSIYSLLQIEDYEEEGIIYEMEEHFNYYCIEKKYIDLLKNKFLKDMCGCGCITPSDKVTVDTLTMGLEVIKYLVQYSQYYEADRIVSLLSTCTGIVNSNCNCYA